MSHSLNIIWVHVAIRTKDHGKIITELEENLYKFLNRQLIGLDCFVKAINGVADHVHLLFLLNPKRSISEVMKHVKGSSSLWINSEKLTKEKFQWQTGYTSFSVSEHHMDKVAKYIARQKEHHSVKKHLVTEEEILYLNSIINP